jgi:cytochrome c biogenesis protein CcmG, thiol:disulfide interchange protein DsbE
MRRNLLLLLPPLIFAGFAALAFVALTSGDPGLPSALEGRPAPSLAATTGLRDDPPPSDDLLSEPGVKLVNFWASWCAPCRVEHPYLAGFAEEGIPVIGINYKDDPDNARGFLAELGDPYAAVGADASGRTGIDWGLHGVPETFVIDGAGRIVHRHAGPITPDVLEKRLRPVLEAAGG